MSFCTPQKFQSTLPRRERRHYGGSLCCNSFVSIHAPTKGATSVSPWSLPLPAGFNPRSHEGSDKDWCCCWRSPPVSIHAPTKGATLPWCPALCSGSSFNPRSHEGSDTGKVVMQLVSFVSIHAPTKGATMTCKNT